MKINKLYRYYLKKIFLRTWAFWITLALLLVVWFALPFLIYYRFKNLTASELKMMGYSEDAQKIEKEGFKGYASLIYSQKLEKNYEEYLTKMEQTGQTENANSAKEKLRIMQDFNLRTIFYHKLVNFFSYNRSEKYAEKISFWKLTHELSLWDLTGLVVSFFLTYNILEILFIQSKKNSEEATILTLTPGVQRKDLFWSKILAFLTFFLMFSLVSFIFPCAFYYWWVGINPSWGQFVILTFWMTIAGPILFFGFPLLIYLYIRDYVSAVGGLIFKYALIFFSFLWEFIKWIPALETWATRLEKWYFNPVVYTVFTLFCGIIFLVLYYWKYQKEDIDTR